MFPTMTSDSFFNAIAHALCWALEWLAHDYWRITLAFFFSTFIVGILLITQEPTITRNLLAWAVGITGPILGIRWHWRSGE